MWPHFRYAILAGALLFAGSPSHACGEAEKAPVPNDEDRKRAIEIVADLFKDDYKAATTDEQRAILARKIFQVGVKTADDVVARYVLFRIARDIAADAGDVETALGAASHLADDYAIDVLASKAEVLTRLTKTLHVPQQHQQLASEFQESIVEALGRDQFDIAQEIHRAALSSARQARSGDLLRQVVKLGKDIEELKAEHAKIAGKLAKLEHSPADPEANAVVGEYLCFVKRDWVNGLPMLALGDNAMLKALAEAELADAPDALKLGDAWWEFSESVEGRPHDASRQRSATWYARALPHLSGLSRKLVGKRLAAITASEPPKGAEIPEGPQAETPKRDDAWAEFDIVNGERLDGFVRLPSDRDNGNFGTHLATKESFSGPILITLVARTDSTNIRIFAYGGLMVVWNWHRNPNEIRLHNPGASRTIQTAKASPLKPDEWYQLQCGVNKNEVVIAHNGKVVFRKRGPFNLSRESPIKVAGAFGSVVDVQAFAVKKLNDTE